MKRVFCLLATCALLFSCVKEEVEEKVRVYKGDVAMGVLQAQTAGALDIESGTTVNLTDVIVSGNTAVDLPLLQARLTPGANLY
jgi:PBP1b-binding outer membrane lipoprotein LpoB